VGIPRHFGGSAMSLVDTLGYQQSPGTPHHTTKQLGEG
jgi:hypothetical protein